MFIDIVKDESNLEVANTTNDYIAIEVKNVNGIVEASGSECVLEGLDINAVEDNIHATPRTNEGIINRNGSSKHNFVQQNYGLKKVIQPMKKQVFLCTKLGIIINRCKGRV